MNLYSNPDLTAKLGEKARKFAMERYSFEQALMAYEAVFYQAVFQKVPRLLPAIQKKLEVRS